ncbi:lactose-binding lectin l-2-like [Pempheris klunzingeri]|uniref:lactose-binding lectin l-2-like n=1 Tax=Pempheris klunzingeri TaxID=3127111 RepID=UPI00397FA691
MGFSHECIATRMTWAGAELHCVSEGANLVSNHSLEEHEFVRSLMRGTWIGLSDVHKEGGWTWSDGCAVKFVFWSLGQPDNAGENEHSCP